MNNRSYNFRLVGLIRCSGMNQQSFAKIINICFQTLSHIICMRRAPTKEQRFAIARYFGKTETYIFGKEREPSRIRKIKRIKTGL
jgi:transcriptional regulator with XRE-family HTH domain